MHPVIREILGSALASGFDPQPILFKPADERGVRPVRHACRASVGQTHRLGTPLNRNAFLCGCLDFTEPETIEHLIVGFGARHGSTTRVSRIAHVSGSDRSVDVPSSLQQQMQVWLAGEHRNDVLVFHAHPRNFLNVLFDNAPLPSGTDRNTMLGYYLHPLVAIKVLLGGGRVRFFLGENGFVQEFRTPDVWRIIEYLNQLQGPQAPRG